MKGLLYKDLAMIFNAYKKNFFLVLVIYSGMAWAMEMPFMLYAMVFLVGMYAVSSLSFDENSRWDVYARTLPVTPGQIVAAKYLLALGFMAAGVGVALAVLCGIDLVRGAGLGGVSVNLSGCLGALAMVLLYHAVSFPLSYKLGSTKARSYVLMAMSFLALGIFFAARIFGDGLDAAFASLEAITDVQVLLFILLLTAAALLAYGISWWISAAIYRRKEY